MFSKRYKTTRDLLQQLARGEWGAWVVSIAVSNLYGDLFYNSFEF